MIKNSNEKIIVKTSPKDNPKKILVITEKFDVALKISTILSNGSSKRSKIDKSPIFEFDFNGDKYTVVGLRGHIIKIDYSERYKKWDIDTLKSLINGEIIKVVSEKSIFSVITKLSNDADEIIVATDYDREGELIGAEAINFILNQHKIPVKRAKFSSLTRDEIIDSFTHLIDINWNLAHAAETRQIIDLIWGATLTRFLTLSSKGNGKHVLSIGRVQGPTLALLVKRYNEIKNFIPEPRWKIRIRVKAKNVSFDAFHKRGPFTLENEALEIMNIIKDSNYGKVTEVNYTDYKEYPPPPFNTTTFLVDATRLGFSASRAMSIAEKLYTSGYISYPRTDNTVYSHINFKKHLEKIKTNTFAEEFDLVLSQPDIIPTKGKIKSTDHPPIYPVSKATKKDLSVDEWKLYELVVRRFLATLYRSATVKRAEITLAVGTEPFYYKDYDTIDPGWYKIYIYSKMKKANLPDVSNEQNFPVEDKELIKEMTKPPSMYSQASLLTEMERLNLGTKSTRPDIIQKLFIRKYLEGGKLIPSASGIAVAESLLKHAPVVTDPAMTAELESEMNSIAENGKEMDVTINDSKIALAKVVDILLTNREKIGTDIENALYSQHYLGKCPLCKNNLVMRFYNKKRFIGCSGYPKCRYTLSIPQNGSIRPSTQKCDLCSSDMIEITTKGAKKEFLCLNSKCIKNKINPTKVGACPSCGKDLILRYGPNGRRFIGCSNYPSCNVTYPLTQYGEISSDTSVCSVCGAPVIEVTNKNNSKWKSCVNPKCSTRKNKTESK